MSLIQDILSELYKYFWLLVFYVGGPAYLYYFYQDGDMERFGKVVVVLLFMVFLYHVALWVYWGIGKVQSPVVKNLLRLFLVMEVLTYFTCLAFVLNRGRVHQLGGKRRRA